MPHRPVSTTQRMPWPPKGPPTPPPGQQGAALPPVPGLTPDSTHPWAQHQEMKVCRGEMEKLCHLAMLRLPRTKLRELGWRPDPREQVPLE